MKNYPLNSKRYTQFPSNIDTAGFLLIVLMAVISFCPACDNAERTTQIITAPEDGAQELPMGEGLDIGALAPRLYACQIATENLITFHSTEVKNSSLFSTAPAHEAAVVRNSVSCKPVMKTSKPKGPN